MALFQSLRERFCIEQDLLLVTLELVGACLCQSDGKSGDSVVVGTALMAREDGGVYLFFEVVALLFPLTTRRMPLR
jgi:hypothetical protein